MKMHGLLVTAAFAVFASAPALAQQSVETAEQTAPTPESAPVPAQADAAAAPAAKSDAAKSDAADDTKRADNDALLRAQAAGYKLVNKDGREIFCKKEMVTGSRLATRTRCLTLAQIEAERNATKDMLLDMSRKTINVPQE